MIFKSPRILETNLATFSKKSRNVGKIIPGGTTDITGCNAIAQRADAGRRTNGKGKGKNRR